MLERKIKKWITNVTGPLSKEEEAVLAKAQDFFKQSGKEELSTSVFQSLHDSKKQKLLGITYTPPVIREELTRTVLRKLLETKKVQSLKVMDPCCGSGAFSITLIEQLSGLGVHPLEALKNNVFFCDVDKLSVALAMVNIREYLARHQLDATQVKPNAKVMDFFRGKGSFDAFITNPPYVKLQNLEQETRDFLRDTYPALFKGSLGLAPIFFKKMFDDLKENGVVGVITQNNFFTSKAGVSLREELQNHI
jgi:methylase of polypeptide subunit release factors